MSMAARPPDISTVTLYRPGAGGTGLSQDKDIKMPIVTVQITREGSVPDRSAATAAEKSAIIKGVSQLLLDVLNKPLESTYVVIEEVDRDNWGRGGLPTAQYRQRISAAKS